MDPEKKLCLKNCRAQRKQTHTPYTNRTRASMPDTDVFYSTDMLALALLEALGEHAGVAANSTASIVELLCRVAREKRVLRLTSHELALSETLKMCIEALPDALVAKLPLIVAPGGDLKSFPVSDAECSVGFQRQESTDPAAQELVGCQAVLVAFWDMLQLGMPQHPPLYRLALFDVVLQGVLHRTREDVPAVLRALGERGYCAEVAG